MPEAQDYFADLYRILITIYQMGNPSLQEIDHINNLLKETLQQIKFAGLERKLDHPFIKKHLDNARDQLAFQSGRFGRLIKTCECCPEFKPDSPKYIKSKFFASIIDYALKLKQQGQTTLKLLSIGSGKLGDEYQLSWLLMDLGFDIVWTLNDLTYFACSDLDLSQEESWIDKVIDSGPKKIIDEPCTIFTLHAFRELTRHPTQRCTIYTDSSNHFRPTQKPQQVKPEADIILVIDIPHIEIQHIKKSFTEDITSKLFMIESHTKTKQVHLGSQEPISYTWGMMIPWPALETPEAKAVLDKPLRRVLKPEIPPGPPNKEEPLPPLTDIPQRNNWKQQILDTIKDALNTAFIEDPNLNALIIRQYIPSFIPSLQQILDSAQNNDKSLHQAIQKQARIHAKNCFQDQFGIIKKILTVIANVLLCFPPICIIGIIRASQGLGFFLPLTNPNAPQKKLPSLIDEQLTKYAPG